MGTAVSTQTHDHPNTHSLGIKHTHHSSHMCRWCLEASQRVYNTMIAAGEEWKQELRFWNRSLGNRFIAHFADIVYVPAKMAPRYHTCCTLTSYLLHHSHPSVTWRPLTFLSSLTRKFTRPCHLSLFRFAQLARVFLDAGVYLEVALPTISRMLSSPGQLTFLDGLDLWGSNR